MTVWLQVRIIRAGVRAPPSPLPVAHVCRTVWVHPIERRPSASDRARHHRWGEVSREMLNAVDEWRREQPNLPTRATAIRRLAQIGLKAKTEAKSVSKPGRRQRAQELATKSIEKMIDPKAGQMAASDYVPNLFKNR